LTDESKRDTLQENREKHSLPTSHHGNPMTTPVLPTTPNTQATPMTDKMTLSSFLRLFDAPSDAIDYILEAHDAGNVETTEYTLPYYTYNRLANPPRFISYACSTQIHSYEVAITGLSLTMVIEFPMGDSDAIHIFSKYLQHALSDAWGGFEHEEINISNPDDLECSALALQHETNLNRVFGIREFITKCDPTYITDAQFERNCRDLVDLIDENEAITERIQHINDVQYISQLA